MTRLQAAYFAALLIGIPLAVILAPAKATLPMANGIIIGVLLAFAFLILVTIV